MRRRWRALVSLALLLGLAGGVVLTAAAGARRTDTAYPRLLTWAERRQVTVLPGGLDPAYFAALTRLPQVAAVATAMQYNIALPVPGGLPDNQVEVLASPDGSLGTTVDRVKVLQGRMFGPGTAGEAVIDPQLAAREHLRPGDTLHLVGDPVQRRRTRSTDLAKLAGPADLPGDGHRRLRRPGGAHHRRPTASRRILLSPGVQPATGAAGLDRLPGRRRGCGCGRARTRPRSSPRAQALASRYPGAAANVDSSSSTWPTRSTATERAIRPQAVALAVFAALAGLIALAVIGQLLARQLALDAAEFPVLRALGMTRGSLLALAAGPAGAGHRGRRGHRRRRSRSRRRR